MGRPIWPAFAARLWTYHGWYDDLLFLIPMIALFRLAKQGTTDRQKVWAGSLFAAMVLSTLAPGGLYLLPVPWNQAFVTVQLLVWAAACAFLLRATRRPLTRPPTASAPRRPMNPLANEWWTGLLFATRMRRHPGRGQERTTQGPLHPAP